MCDFNTCVKALHFGSHQEPLSKSGPLSLASNENATGGEASWLLRLGHKRSRDFYLALSLDRTILKGVRGQATVKQSQGGDIVKRPPRDRDACLAVPGSSFSHLPSPSTTHGSEEAFETTPVSASSWWQSHEKPGARTTQLSPVGPPNHQRS